MGKTFATSLLFEARLAYREDLKLSRFEAGT